ncbi:hypothetical protein CKA32_004832 [Geitlerinema sp. FC II]|nr:hypothetical protein CKA32_004832 [Geitlerinema sp. FC II]
MVVLLSWEWRKFLQGLQMFRSGNSTRVERTEKQWKGTSEN